MTPAIRQHLFQIVFLVLIQAVILFVSVWRLDWWNAWAYLALYLAYLILTAIVLLGRHPDLVEERSRVGEGAKSWDKVIAMITGVGFISLLILAGLDERQAWTGPLPPWVQIAGLILLGASYPLFTWAMVSNEYFSPIVRIQRDRGHAVQSGGPYRYIRHPGYLSLLISYLMLPVALGSWWAEIPAGLLVVNLLVRTTLEDRTLQSELEGYQEYTTRVRFRLIPGIW